MLFQAIRTENDGSKENELMQQLVSIFMPHAKGRLDAIHAAKKRMIHYTSAENLFKIISSKTMWMRNTNCMSDYSEVEHGYQLLWQFFEQENQRKLLYDALNNCQAGVAEEAIRLFDQWWQNIRFNTFITSISEHEDNEDGHGRLSMWRGFGRTTARAAIVLRLPQPGSAEGLQVMLSPVAYFGYAEVEQQMWDVVANIKANETFLRGLDRERLKRTVLFMLITGSVSLKHIGFAEEKEWRLICLPDANPSALIKSSAEIIEGIPQMIYKIPLEKNPDNDVIGTSIPALLDRIIIGPTVYPIPMATAFISALQAAGVADAGSRVFVSGIPIRS